MASSNMFVFDCNLKASSNMNAKFFDLRADLTRTAESAAIDHLVQNLTGTVSFGNGVPDYNFVAGTFDATNNTLKAWWGVCTMNGLCRYYREISTKCLIKYFYH